MDSNKIMPLSDCKELNDLIKRIALFCEDYGYSSFELSIDEKESFYSVNAYLTRDNNVAIVDGRIPRPKKVTLEDIEKRFGCPVEIVP